MVISTWNIDRVISWCMTDCGIENNRIVLCLSVQYHLCKHKQQQMIGGGNDWHNQ